jgi:hypothetical protein
LILWVLIGVIAAGGPIAYTQLVKRENTGECDGWNGYVLEIDRRSDRASVAFGQLSDAASDTELRRAAALFDALSNVPPAVPVPEAATDFHAALISYYGAIADYYTALADGDDEHAVSLERSISEFEADYHERLDDLNGRST